MNRPLPSSAASSSSWELRTAAFQALTKASVRTSWRAAAPTSSVALSVTGPASPPNGPGRRPWMTSSAPLTSITVAASWSATACWTTGSFTSASDVASQVS